MKKIRLYTYSASQASEKVRWALDLADVPYEEIRLTPFVHVGELFRSMPILEAEDETITDSTRILEWLDSRRAPFRLIPRDPVAREAVMNAEARFDLAGVHLLRYVYSGLLQNRSLALRLWSIDASLIQKLALTMGFPIIRRLFVRGVGFDDRQLGRSKRIIDRAIAELDRLAESGNSYLVGRTVSVADLTAAALLSPLACPDEHPLYSCPDYRAAMKTTVQRWDTRPGIAWVRGMYRRHRRAALAEQKATTGPMLAPIRFQMDGRSLAAFRPSPHES